MVEKLANNLYTFKIRLPRNPLQWLNCYVIKGGEGERNLLVDSGFKKPVCLADLKAGMAELELDPKETDVYFTHFHVDHVGNGKALADMGCRIFMGSIEYQYFRDARWKNTLWHMVKDGMPQHEVDYFVELDAKNGTDPTEFTAQTVEPGGILSYGGYDFECLVMPGHTAGNTCLYDRRSQIMLTGDCVLFDITPNITNSGMEDMDNLGMYLDSLDRITQYPVRMALPAHRGWGRVSLAERVEELKGHHAVRLAEVERIVTENPGISAYETARYMTWQIKAKTWEDFPLSQKQFATGEANAHLIHLSETGVIRRLIDDDGNITYSK